MRGLYTEFSAERIQALVDDAVQKGAKVGAGTTLKREGNLLQPVIVEGVTTDMRECLVLLWGIVLVLTK
jgi:acyl-CoA reductase-like NAD-dependent aldehyde dehydrogenase